MHSQKVKLFPTLQNSIDRALQMPIPEERTLILHKLVQYIQSKLDEGKDINLNFICNIIRVEVNFLKSGHKQQLTIMVFWPIAILAV